MQRFPVRMGSSLFEDPNRHGWIDWPVIYFWSAVALSLALAALTIFRQRWRGRKTNAQAPKPAPPAGTSDEPSSGISWAAVSAIGALLSGIAAILAVFVRP